MVLSVSKHGCIYNMLSFGARMRSEAYGIVMLSVCLSVTMLRETALACKLRLRFQQVDNRVFQSFERRFFVQTFISRVKKIFVNYLRTTI